MATCWVRAEDFERYFVMAEQKTIEQLEREIQYFAAQLQRTESRDRRLRCHKAIALRERKLIEAKQRLYAAER